MTREEAEEIKKEIEERSFNYFAFQTTLSAVSLEDVLEVINGKVDIIKKSTHVVIKNADIQKYLTEGEKGVLNAFLIAIQQGRQEDGKKPINDYYVCNADEPYAEEVLNVILKNEVKHE